MPPRIVTSLRARLLTVAGLAVAPLAVATLVVALGAGGWLDDAQDLTREELLRDLAVVVAMGLALGFGMAWLGVRRLILYKVDVLEQMASRIRAGETGVRTGADCDTWEFARLARTFDSMATTLDERSQAHQEDLRASEERFRQLAMIAPAGIFRMDRDLNWTYVNPRCQELTGRREAELLGRAWMGCIHPHDREWVMLIMDLAATRGDEIDLREYRILRPDGSVVWVLARDTMERDGGGKVVGRIGMLMDVTNLKLTSDALRESEERFRKLARIAPVGIYRADNDGLCTYANDRLAAILGRSKGEMRGLHLGELIQTEEPPTTDGTSECRIRLPGGGSAWALVQDVVERDSQGLPVGRIGIVLDVTAQTEAKAALRQSEERLRTLAQAAPVAIFRADLDGYIHFVNERWADITGLPVERALGHGWLDSLLPDEAEDLRRAFLEGVRAPRPIEREHRVLRPDGSAVWVLTRAVAEFDSERRPVGYVGTMTDITVQKQSADALRRARLDAEAANQSKSRFLAAASHDLRQPFQAMRLFRAALDPFLAEGRAQTIGAKLDEAMTAGEELLKALLDVSTLEAGIVTPNPTSFDAAELIHRLARECLPQAESAGLKLKIHALHRRIHTDPVLLERMLRNLLHNAVRYTPKGGILLGARMRQGRVLFQVWDTGIGIAADQQGKVFEDFYQIGNPNRDRACGLGLGLSVVARTGDLLHLPVGLSSRPGKGSVFWVSVPLGE